MMDSSWLILLSVLCLVGAFLLFWFFLVDRFFQYITDLVIGVNHQGPPLTPRQYNILRVMRVAGVEVSRREIHVMSHETVRHVKLEVDALILLKRIRISTLGGHGGGRRGRNSNYYSLV